MSGPWEQFQATEQGPWSQFAVAPQAAEEPEKQSAFRQVADIPLGFGRGMVQGVRMIADAFGAGSDASKTIKGAEDYLAGLMSAQAQNDQREISRIMKEAEDKGVLDQVQAGFKAFAQAPVDLLTQAFGTAVPAIVGTLGAKVLGAGALVATGAGVLTGAGMGAGTVKGSIYEETKKALKEAGATEEVAEEKAQQAQAYGGKNLDQILLGTVLGGAAAAGPLEKGAAGMLARRILGKASGEEVAEEVAKGALRRRAQAGALEAVPEALQAGQEQVAQNIALQREGFDVPTARGVAGAATLEGLAGAGLGAASAGRPARPEPATEEKPTPPALEYKPDPYLQFADGTVAKQSEVEAFLKTLPENEQMAMRAKLIGLAPQEGEKEPEFQPSGEDVKLAPPAPTAPAAIEAATPPVAPTEPLTETPSAEAIEPTSGAGVSVAGGPAAVTAAEGVRAAEPVRVVSPVADVGRPTEGARAEPRAVEPEGERVDLLIPLPKALQSMSKANRDLYDLDRQIAEASVPISGFDWDIKDSLGEDERGMTFESAFRSLDSALAGVRDTDGKLRGGNRTAATPQKLIDAWKTASQIQAFINQQKEAKPELWENYVARQNDLGANAEIGDTVITPLGPAKLDKRFEKNYRVEFLEGSKFAGEKMLFPPQSLRLQKEPTVEPSFEDRIQSLKDQQQALLTKSGKIPAPKSPARIKYDALEAEIQSLSVPPVETVEQAVEVKPAEQTVTGGKPRKRPTSIMGSPMLADIFFSLGGLDTSLLSEFSTRFATRQLDRKGRPVTRYRNPMIRGFGTLFNNRGTTDFTEIATVLEDRGYLEPGSVERDPTEAGERAKQLILKALNREEVLPVDERAEKLAAEREEADRQADLERREENRAIAYGELQLDEEYMGPEDLQEALDLENEFATEMEIYNLEPEDFTFLSDQEFEEGLTDAERAAAEERRARKTEQDTARETAAAVPAGEAPAFDLERPTAEGLKAQEERIKEAEKREAAAQKAAKESERKAREERELRLRAEQTLADFELGKTAEEQMSGIEDMFKEEKPRTATKEQMDAADGLAASVGGTVVYQDGDISLIRGHSVLTGQPVYMVGNGNYRSKVDIESYTGNLITPEQKSELTKIKKDLEKADEKAFKEKPFIRFDDGLAVSGSVPIEIAGIVRGWKDLLNLKPNLYVTTIEDARANKDNFNGPHRAISSSSLSATEAGSVRKLPNGDYYIAFQKGTSKTKMLEILGHELGHMHEREVFNNADPETQKALRDEHSKWLKSQTGKTAKELIESLRAKTSAKTTRIEKGLMADRLTPYWKSFSEWYADQVSRWSVTNEKPVSVVEKFFSRLGQALRNFYNKIRNQGYLPNETFVQYLDKVNKQPGLIGTPTKNEPPSGESLMSTETSAFKRWFGNSKVVDADGNPLVVYHGTGQLDDNTADGAIGQFMDFSPVWFAADAGLANVYASQSPYGAPTVYPVFLSVQRPLRMSFDMDQGALLVVPYARRIGVSEEDIDFYQDGPAYDFVRSRPFVEAAQSKGYDGFIVNEDGVPTYAIFDSNQIKSAIGNVGTFDPNNPDIRYMLGEAKAKIEAKKEAAVQKALVEGREAMQKRRLDKGAFEGVSEDLFEELKPVFAPQNVTVLDRIYAMRDNFWQRVAQGMADQFRTIKEYSYDAYIKARLSKSTDGALEGLMFYGQVFNDGGALNVKKNTRGMFEILKPVGKELDRYLIWVATNRDAMMPQDKRSISDKIVSRRSEFSAGTLNGKPREEVYRQVQKDMNQLNRSVLKVAVDTGLLNTTAGAIKDIENNEKLSDAEKQKKIAELRANPIGYERFINDLNYIPFYKIMEKGDLDSVQKAVSASGLTSQYFSKALKGGEKPFGDLMENTLKNWSHILSASMKNQAGVAAIEAAVKAGVATPNLRVGLDFIDGKVYSSKTGELVGDGELRPEHTESGDGSVNVMVDGKKVYYQISDPLLMDSITSIGYLGKQSKFLDVARDFKNLLQYGVTISPQFKVNNLIRDSVAAMGVSELKLNPIANVMQGVSLSNRNSETYIAAMAGGGVFNFGTAYEGDQSKLIKRLLKMGVDRDHVLDSDNKIKNGLKYAWDKYNEWGNRSENANRLALYKQLREKGMSHLEATFKARDLMDFSMQGSWPAFRMLTQVIPFLNARVQGLYKLGRDGINPTVRVINNALTGKEIEATDRQKAQQFSIVSMGVVMASALLYLTFKDDEEYKRRDDWDKDNFWWFRVPGMDFALRVPKPFEIGALGTLVERTLEQILDSGAEGKEFGDALFRMLTNTFAINPTPQIIKPLVDIYANKDSFSGAPIESAGLERLSKQERMTETTTPLGIALGKISSLFPEKFEISPVQADYLIKGYFGWLGGTIAATSTYATMPFREGEYPDARWMDRASLGLARELPGRGAKYVTAFYDANKEISQAYADMRHYAQIGDSEKVQQILEEKGDKIRLQKFYDKTAKTMANIRKQIRLVQVDKQMDGAAKKEAIDRMQDMISMLAKQAEDVRKSMKGG